MVPNPALTLWMLAALAACDRRSTAAPRGLSTDPSDSSLVVLSLGQTRVAPPFDPERRYYAIPASALSQPASVDAVASNPDATVEIRVETVDGVASSTGAELDVSEDQRVLVEVTSADGTASRTYSIGLLPDDFTRPTAVGSPTPGWTFVGSANLDDVAQRFLMIVDDLGTPAWWRRGRSQDLRIAPDGRLTWIGYLSLTGGTRRNLVLGREGGEYDVVLGPGPVPAGWESVDVDEHEWYLLEDNTAIRIINGKVKEDLRAWGGAADQLVENQKAQHIDLEGNVLFEFSTQGLLPYDVLPPNLLAKLPLADFEAFHVNSVDVDPNDGHWVLSFQRVSMVAKVARHGPQAGEVLWRLGGPVSDFAILDDTRPSGWVGFAGQHGVRVVGPDRIAMYDAGLGDSEGIGDVRFVEYQLDTTTMEARVVDEHVFVGSGNGLAGGSVQEMPGGGQLIGFGSLRTDDQGAQVPVATEITADGEEAWSLYFPEGSWSYRAWRFYGDPLTGEWSTRAPE